ncbi:DUF1329 domain-containing protein [Aquipseudomonas campi]
MNYFKLSALVLVLGFSSPLLAANAISADELGKTYTPLGGERAGNAAGTIPAWTGGLPRDAAPVSANGRLGNPFAGEKPLFVITAQNAAQYEANLTPGQKALLQRYPTTFRIPVYPTHRTAAVPDSVAQAAARNVTGASLSANGYGMQAFEVSTPFPFASTGVEAIWNHISRYRGGSVKRQFVQVTPQVNGSYTPVLFVDQMSTREELTDFNASAPGRVLYYMKQQVLAPSRLAGTALLAHETMDQASTPRQAWIYNAGQRRVRLAPQVAYDGPGTAADGLRTADNYDLYNGSPDRYDWTIKGKQEIYIPYNSYLLEDPKLKYDDVVKAGHLNPDHTRYELHRVWVVEANLKPEQRHLYAKRVFFIDEDTWQVATVDHYDSRGGLWRVGEGHAMQFYHVQVPWYRVETLYDLLSGRYIALGMNNEENAGYQFGARFSSADFTPSALRQAGIR